MSIGAMTENVAIAYYCTIENAVGGSGSDLIVGNFAGNFGHRPPVAHRRDQWGLGLAFSALACGLPLAVLPTDLEKMLNGRALERIGIGHSIAIKDAGQAKTADEIAGAVADAAGDAGLARRATELAPEFRKRLEHNPADAVADTVMELAGSGK